jgi:hypothetical protein
MARGHALPDPHSIRSNVAIVMLAGLSRITLLYSTAMSEFERRIHLVCEYASVFSSVFESDEGTAAHTLKCAPDRRDPSIYHSTMHSPTRDVKIPVKVI